MNEVQFYGWKKNNMKTTQETINWLVGVVKTSPTQITVRDLINSALNNGVRSKDISHSGNLFQAIQALIVLGFIKSSEELVFMNDDTILTLGETTLLQS